MPRHVPDTFFGHPRPLSTLFHIELWERFSYYGMQSILLIYLYYEVTRGGLGIDQGLAGGIVGIYGGSVYLATILGGWLADITGFAGVSFQPNSGAQGEYAGLLAIREYLLAQGQTQRNICLIPASAHGTNPASAQLAGLKIVVVACDAHGNIDVADLDAKLATHRDALACLMVTYPSTHGVFEASIRDICRKVHEAGGQVYMDGANMNAQAGLTKPGERTSAT